MSNKCSKWRKNIVPLKWISLCILAILPIFTIPNWCIKANLNGTDDCLPDEYPNSNMVKFSPQLTTSLTLISYIFLSCFVVMRLFIKKRTKSAVIRSVVMCALMLCSAVDLIWILIDNDRSTTALVNIFNVLLILFFVRAIREVWV